MEKFIVKKEFQFPMPPDGSGLKVEANDKEPAELDLKPEKRQELIEGGFIEPYEAH